MLRAGSGCGSSSDGRNRSAQTRPIRDALERTEQLAACTSSPQRRLPGYGLTFRRSGRYIFQVPLEYTREHNTQLPFIQPPFSSLSPPINDYQRRANELCLIAKQRSSAIRPGRPRCSRSAHRSVHIRSARLGSVPVRCALLRFDLIRFEAIRRVPSPLRSCQQQPATDSVPFDSTCALASKNTSARPIPMKLSVIASALRLLLSLKFDGLSPGQKMQLSKLPLKLKAAVSNFRE